MEGPEALKCPDRPNPVNGTDRNLHGVDPIDPATGRVVLKPARQLRFELGGEALVLRESGSTSERQQLMTSTELPWELGIAGIAKSGDLQVLIEVARPPVTGPEVLMPVDDRSQVHGAGAEVVHLVTEHTFRLGQDSLGRALKVRGEIRCPPKHHWHGANVR